MMYIALNPKSCTPKVVSLVRSHSLFLSLIPAHIDDISCKMHMCMMHNTQKTQLSMTL